MDPPVIDNVNDIMLQGVKDVKAADERTSRPGSAAEVLRLQNAMKVKDKELDDARKEVTALRANLSTKDRALQQSEQELRILKERNTATDVEVTNMAKELAVLKVDKRKLETQLAGLVKKGEKEQMMATILAQEKAAAAAAAAVTATEGNAFTTLAGSDHLAVLQADLRIARLDGEKAAESIKALETVLRAKDKQINVLQRKSEEAETHRTKCTDLENRLVEMNRQLDEVRSAGRTAADVLRGSDADKARLTADLAKTKAALDGALEAAARTSAALRVSELRCGALEQEVGTLVAQLARASVVAQRVAVAEVKAGCKDEGMVHMTRHIEEVRFMSGEIVRLQERIVALEKELAVADELKDQYRRQSQQGSPAMNSPTCTSPAAATAPATTTTTIRPIARPGSRGGSRPSSAPRRPGTAVSSSTSRPSSAPRVRSAVRASTNSIPAGAAAAAAAAAGPSAGAAAASSSSPSVRSSVGALQRKVVRQQQPWNSNAPSPAKPATTSPRAPAVGASAAGGFLSRAAAQAKTGSKSPGAAPSKARAAAAAVAAALAEPAAAVEGAAPADAGAGPSEAAPPATEAQPEPQLAAAEADLLDVAGVAAGGEAAASPTEPAGPAEGEVQAPSV